MEGLEGIRARTRQLAHSLALAKGGGEMAHVLLSQLLTLSASLDANKRQLQSLLIHPTPAFPVEHEQLLLLLLRTKLTPQVAGWMQAASDPQTQQAHEARWLWAAEVVRHETEARPWNGRYTNEEGEGEEMQVEMQAEKTGDITPALKYMSSGWLAPPPTP